MATDVAPGSNVTVASPAAPFCRVTVTTTVTLWPALS
jgi:hypothetical protein